MNLIDDRENTDGKSSNITVESPDFNSLRRLRRIQKKY